ncbi:hypothetical protein ABPG72_006535 [Tetrahymena utriculariae]
MSSQKLQFQVLLGTQDLQLSRLLLNQNQKLLLVQEIPSKAKELQNSGAQVIKADMSQNQNELVKILSNTVLFTLQANFQYLLVVSQVCADNQNVLFGRQHSPIEKELKISGLKYGILRLPIFFDNVWDNNEPIRTHNTFYGPIIGDKKFVTVAVQDAALATAKILQNPTKHIEKTYTITSNYRSNDELAQIFSQALGRQIKYVNATFEGQKQALLKFMPKWLIDGVMELYKLIEKGDASQVNHTNNFYQIVGSQTTTNLSWMWQNFKAF